MYLDTSLSTRLVSREVIHMFGAVLWVAKTWKEAGITEPVRGSFDKHAGGRHHNPRARSVSDRQDIIKLVAGRSGGRRLGAQRLSERRTASGNGGRFLNRPNLVTAMERREKKKEEVPLSRL